MLWTTHIAILTASLPHQISDWDWHLVMHTSMWPFNWVVYSRTCQTCQVLNVFTSWEYQTGTNTHTMDIVWSGQRMCRGTDTTRTDRKDMLVQEMAIPMCMPVCMSIDAYLGGISANLTGTPHTPSCTMSQMCLNRISIVGLLCTFVNSWLKS